MQDAIQPLHRLSFTDLSAEGVQGIAMNPVAPTVYVHQQLVDPLAVALAYWPWVLTPIAVLLLAFILWRTLRILSRPQRKGVPHCRKCNYDLSGAIVATPTAPLSLGALTKGEGRGEGSTPPAFSPSSTSLPSASCPECGRALTPRTILKGRSTRRRLLPLAVPGALLLTVLVLVVAMANGWRPLLQPWPSTTAQVLLNRLSLTPPPRFVVECSTVIEVDLATGATLRTIAAQRAWSSGISVAPTGDSMLITGRAFDPIVRVSIPSGRELGSLGPYRRPEGLRYHNPITGWAPDGKSAYIAIPAETPAQTRVVRWSFADGSLKVLAETPTYANNRSGGHWMRPTLPFPGNPDRILALPSFMEARTTMTYTVAIHAGVGFPVLSANLGRDLEEQSNAVVTPDGQRMYLVGQNRKLVAFNLPDFSRLGSVDLPPPAESMSVGIDASGRLVAAGGFRAIAIRDTDARDWIALLTIPEGLLRCANFAFSPDARFVTAKGLRHDPASTSFHEDLLIWDLDPLHTKRSSAP